MRFIKNKLGEVIPGIKPYLHVFGHDLYDVALAAYAAFLYHDNRVDAFGSSQEGLIHIPAKR
jgi:hypothetical protein